MNLNATLFGQMITFTLFVWVTMRYVWPPIMKAMKERQQTIAEGLAAAERSEHDLELAQHRIAQQLREAKVQAADIIEQANRRSVQIIEEAKQRSREEGERLMNLAHSEIEQERQRVMQQLRKDAVNFAVLGAEKLLQRNVDEAADAQLLDALFAELEN